jgi:hypothetical protein
MRQVAGNATLEGIGQLNGCGYVLHDRDAKFCAEFRETLAAGGMKCLRLPPRSPNLNAFAERWVRSVKEEFSAAYSDTTVAPHEYFDQTGIFSRRKYSTLPKCRGLN